jgi:beta-glucosidase/6-phospho-beta-glucosidase/beta-galactosidase
MAGFRHGGRALGWATHPSRPDLSQLDGLSLPAGFSFGFATAGAQNEGGFNGPGQPRNNWWDWEASGRVERSGVATELWTRYERDFDTVAALGGNAYNLSIEWARVQPSASNGRLQEPPYDERAIDGYARMLAAARERGIEPWVCLHHFTHPRWLGLDFWLQADSPKRFADYVANVVPAINRRLAERHDQPPVRIWITTTEINVLALQTYMAGYFPGAPRPLHVRLRATHRALDHLLAAHIRAYDAIHDAYEAAGWPAPQVSHNGFLFAIYELDRGLNDLLLARERGVARHEIAAYAAERKAAWTAALDVTFGPERDPLERFMGQLARLVAPPRLPAALDALYASPRPRKLDALATDIYHVWLKRRLHWPGALSVGGRDWSVTRKLWEDPPLPDTFGTFCRLAADDTDLPVWVMENGICNRVVDGVAYPRRDGWNRVAYLVDHLASLARAVQDGVPVTAYLHWTLFDNWEWGSYEPRFGLYATERPSGRRLPHDAMGDDAAAAYGATVAALTSTRARPAAFAS